MNTSQKNSFDILSCAGGGFFGYGEILIVQELEILSGKNTYQLFDALVGTSAGAINTSILSIGVPASKVSEFYTIWGPEIFTNSIWDVKAKLKLAPKYDNTQLKLALQSLLQIDDNGTMRQSTLNDCKIRWAGSSFDMTLGLPTFFCSWMKSQRITINGMDVGNIIGFDSLMELWQIVLCSSAAPTYFDGVEIGNVFIDGGLTGCNSMDSISINLLSDQVSNKQIRMLSLGSGDSNWNIDPKSMIHPSDIRAAFVILQMFLSAGVDSSNFGAYMKLKENYFHMSPSYNPTFEMDDVTTGLVKIPLAIDTLLQSSRNVLLNFIK